MRRLAATALVALAACEATGDNSLTGSLSSVYRLDFDTVRARLYSSELAIEYVDLRGAVPVRVSITREGGDLAPGVYDLKVRGDVTGILPDGTMIPDIRSGSARVVELGAGAGSNVVGTFDAIFDTGRDALSLTGTYEATLEVVR